MNFKKIQNGSDPQLLRAYRSAHEDNSIRFASSGSQVIRSAIIEPNDARPIRGRNCVGKCRSVAELMGVDSPGGQGFLEGGSALCGECPEFVCRECEQRPTDEIDGHCQVCVPRPLLSEVGARRALNACVAALVETEGSPNFEKACALLHAELNRTMGIESRPQADISDLVVGLNHVHHEAFSAGPGVDRSEARRKANNDAYYKERRERSTASKNGPPSQAQCEYLALLAARVGSEVFDSQLAVAIQGTDITPRRNRELPVRVIDRLTKSVASKLITLLREHRRRFTSKSARANANDMV